jgi:hypothetical protein
MTGRSTLPHHSHSSPHGAQHPDSAPVPRPNSEHGGVFGQPQSRFLPRRRGKSDSVAKCRIPEIPGPVASAVPGLGLDRRDRYRNLRDSALSGGDIVGSKHCYRGINQTDAEGDVNKLLFMLADGIRVTCVSGRAATNSSLHQSFRSSRGFADSDISQRS